MSNDLKDLIDIVSNIDKTISKGIEKGLKESGAVVVGTAKNKFGTYQPAIGEYPAWVHLKEGTINAKFRGKNGIKQRGKKYLKKYGNFKPSDTSDDDPLIGAGTGHLRRAITVDDSDVSKGVVYIGVAGKGGKGSPADYAAVHEFGSAKRNIPPRPYLRPAMYENRENIEEIIKQRIIDEMSHIKR